MPAPFSLFLAVACLSPRYPLLQKIIENRIIFSEIRRTAGTAFTAPVMVWSSLFLSPLPIGWSIMGQSLRSAQRQMSEPHFPILQ